MKDKIRFFALENAIKFKGKANTGAVIGKILSIKPEAKKDMKTLSKTINKIVSEVNSMSLEEQKKAFKNVDKIKKPKKKIVEGLPPLPKAVKGKVITRIPPEPSKYSHLGHALSFLINYTYAKMYDGKCIVMFEDTNPEKSTQEFADAILEDLEYLKIKPDAVRFASDNMEYMYEMAEKLIKKKKAYVCICDRDMMKDLRDKALCCECSNRNNVEVNLAEWKKMLKGEYDEGQAILRLRGNMESKNHVMRDPVIFRINKKPHFKQKNKYCVWPLYDFENSVSDSLNKITHILRSSEFGKMRIELQNYIKDCLGFRKQVVIQYGRFNFSGATTKGREIRELISSGKVTGWDDPSLVTIRALKRRGILPETFKELMMQMKLSRNTSKKVDWSMISSINKHILDPKVNRYFFIENPKEIKIKKAPKQEIKINLHPDHPKKGSRTFKTHNEFYVCKQDFMNFKKGKLVRLKDCLNFEAGKEHVFHSLDHEEYKSKGNMIIQWLPKSKNLVKVEIRMPDNNIKKGLGEAALKTLKSGDIIQFTRFGFCKLEEIKNNTYKFIFTNK